MPCELGFWFRLWFVDPLLRFGFGAVCFLFWFWGGFVGWFFWGRFGDDFFASDGFWRLWSGAGWRSLGVEDRRGGFFFDSFDAVGLIAWVGFFTRGVLGASGGTAAGRIVGPGFDIVAILVKWADGWVVG